MQNYEISYYKGRFRQLDTKYQLLCFLQKDNVAIVKLMDSEVQKRYEDMYAIEMDTENGVLIFTHSTMVCIGAASTDKVEYAKVISFDIAKELLTYEIDYWNTLVERWESENDISRAKLCREHLLELEKISNTKSSEWKTLLHK